MMKPAMTPQAPTQPHQGPIASFRAPTGLFCVVRPIRSSAIMMGRPTAAMHMR